MPDTAIPYETDWYAWTQQQAALLRELPASTRPNGLDVDNLAEEVESMGASQRRAIRSLLEQIFVHFLKLEFHPAVTARPHWQSEIESFRSQLEGEFADSPSLRPRLPELAGTAWPIALRYARRRVGAEAPEMEARMAAAGVRPETPRYDLDGQVLDPTWFPERWEE